MAEGKTHLFDVASGISHPLPEAVLQRMNAALGISDPNLLTIRAEQAIDLNTR